MLKFLSEMNGLKIILFQEKALLSLTQDYLIEAETASLVAFYTETKLEKGKRALLARDIKGIGADYLLIDSLDSLTEPGEVVRIQRAEEVDPKLIKEKVFTESGQYLGKVRDVTIDLATLKVAKLYVTPLASLQFFTKELLIPKNQIIKIEKNKIIVKDGTGKVKKSLLATVPKPVIS